MAEFKDLAIIIKSVGITETQLNNYFENKIQPPTQPAEPTITKEKVVAVANAMYVDGIENRNGIVTVAQDVGLTTSQVKQIIKEIKTLEAYWSNPESFAEPKPEVIEKL